MMPRSPFSVGQMRCSDSGHLYFYTGTKADSAAAVAASGNYAALADHPFPGPFPGGPSPGFAGSGSGLEGIQRQLSPPAAPPLPLLKQPGGPAEDDGLLGRGLGSNLETQPGGSDSGKKPKSHSGLFNYWKRGAGALPTPSSTGLSGHDLLLEKQLKATTEKELAATSPIKPAKATMPGGDSLVPSPTQGLKGFARQAALPFRTSPPQLGKRKADTLI
jgi:hypothetical protein